MDGDTSDSPKPFPLTNFYTLASSAMHIIISDEQRNKREWILQQLQTEWSEAQLNIIFIVTIPKTGGRGRLKRFLNDRVNFLFVMSTKGGLNIFPEISPHVQGNIWLTQSMKDQVTKSSGNHVQWERSSGGGGDILTIRGALHSPSSVCKISINY